jgi:hypothetical protein
MPKRKTISKPKVSLKKSSSLKRWMLLIPLTIAVVIGGWLAVKPLIFSQAGINEVRDAGLTPDPKYVARDPGLTPDPFVEKDPGLTPDPRYKLPPSGCMYKRVQCVKAPCDPILICNQPQPSTTAVPSPVAGCTKDLFICKDGTKVGRTGDKCEFVCPTPTPTPTPKPTATAAPGCTKDLFICKDGTKVGRTGSSCEFVCPTPPPQAGVVSSFTASNPCSFDSFKDYSYTCKNGQKNLLMITGCQTIQSAMSQVLRTCSAAK